MLMISSQWHLFGILLSASEQLAKVLMGKLLNKLLPVLAKQDNGPCHTANVQEWFKEHELNYYRLGARYHCTVSEVHA